MTPVEQIKDKIDIVDFIKGYIELKPAGKNWRANCPFHSEKTPSFIVSSDRQTWHCFGACSEGGDIFKFLMKHENIEFYEALKILAEKAGIELKKISPADQKQFGILYDINETAKNFFKKQLQQNAGAQKYLNDRGLKKETIEEFELGLSPHSFDELTVNLINLGYDIKDIERSGLNFKNDRGNYTDRFRDRIMFPIYNHFGKVVGFSARILPEFDTGETGKYINSSETPIFSKSRILYGFHKTKNFIREKKSALLVEGQMDFLMCWQDGVKNVVAASGAGSTFDHLKSLKRQTDELIFSFDNDEAGFKAAERSIDMANAFDFNVKVLILKDYKDPAEVVQKAPGTLLGLINETKPAMEFYFERYLGLTNDQPRIVDSPAGESLRGTQPTTNDIGKLKKNIRVILMRIKNITSPVERSHWLKELSEKAKTNESFLMEEMEQLKTQTSAESDSGKSGYTDANQNSNLNESVLDKQELIAERLMTLILIKESLRDKIGEYFDYLPKIYQIVYGVITDKSRRLQSDDPVISNLINAISLRSSLELEKLTDEKMEKEFQELLDYLKSEYLRKKREELGKIIKEAEKQNNEKQLSQALKEFDEISKLLHHNNK